MVMGNGVRRSEYRVGMVRGSGEGSGEGEW